MWQPSLATQHATILGHYIDIIAANLREATAATDAKVNTQKSMILVQDLGVGLLDTGDGRASTASEPDPRASARSASPVSDALSRSFVMVWLVCVWQLRQLDQRDEFGLRLPAQKRHAEYACNIYTIGCLLIAVNNPLMTTDSPRESIRLFTRTLSSLVCRTHPASLSHLLLRVVVLIAFAEAM